MGSKHTRPESTQPVPKPELFLCPTQSSEAESTSPRPSLDPPMYHIRRASLRRSSSHNLPPSSQQYSSHSNLTSPKSNGINVAQANRTRDRPSLPGLVSPKVRPRLPATSTDLSSGRVLSCGQVHIQGRPAPPQFTSPTHLLLKRQLVRDSVPTTGKIEFEDEGTTPAFVRTQKNPFHPSIQQNTYKLLKPKKESFRVEAEMGTPSKDLVTFLREAAAIKYETQPKGSSRNIMDFLGVGKGTTGDMLTPKSAVQAVGGAVGTEGEGLRYKIKSMLNLKLVNAHAEKESGEKKPKMRLWKGRRGTILVPTM